MRLARSSRPCVPPFTRFVRAKMVSSVTPLSQMSHNLFLSKKNRALSKANSVATASGFSKIKVPVFKKIALANIDRVAMLVDPNKSPKLVPELFPMELKGRNTPEHRMKQIWAALSEVKNDEALRARIERELTIRYDEPNAFISEDFGFCDLARAAGYDIWMDTLMVLGHQASVVVPVETAKLLEMLSEPWRKEELAVIKQIPSPDQCSSKWSN